MPKHLPQSSQRTRQIAEHNRKAVAENRPEEVLPTQSSTRIWEPHEWNAEILKRQRARGERPNIAQPKMNPEFVTTTEAPEVRDLNVEAQEKALARRTPKGRKPFPKGVQVEKAEQ